MFVSIHSVNTVFITFIKIMYKMKFETFCDYSTKKNIIMVVHLVFLFMRNYKKYENKTCRLSKLVLAHVWKISLSPWLWPPYTDRTGLIRSKCLDQHLTSSHMSTKYREYRSVAISNIKFYYLFLSQWQDPWWVVSALYKSFDQYLMPGKEHTQRKSRLAPVSSDYFFSYNPV